MKKDNASELAEYAAAGPPEHGLPAIRRLRVLLEDWEAVQVRAARDRGWNWGEIGRVLGRSRQAVHERYRDERKERRKKSSRRRRSNGNVREASRRAAPLGSHYLDRMVRRLVIALAVVGVVLAGGRVWLRRPRSAPTSCAVATSQDAGKIVENVGSATPAELPPSSRRSPCRRGSNRSTTTKS